jgi:hypothetical protein
MAGHLHPSAGVSCQESGPASAHLRVQQHNIVSEFQMYSQGHVDKVLYDVGDAVASVHTQCHDIYILTLQA